MNFAGPEKPGKEFRSRFQGIRFNRINAFKTTKGPANLVSRSRFIARFFPLAQEFALFLGGRSGVCFEQEKAFLPEVFRRGLTVMDTFEE